MSETLNLIDSELEILRADKKELETIFEMTILIQTREKIALLEAVREVIQKYVDKQKQKLDYRNEMKQAFFFIQNQLQRANVLFKLLGDNNEDKEDCDLKEIAELVYQKERQVMLNKILESFIGESASNFFNEGEKTNE